MFEINYDAERFLCEAGLKNEAKCVAGLCIGCAFRWLLLITRDAKDEVGVLERVEIDSTTLTRPPLTTTAPLTNEQDRKENTKEGHRGPQQMSREYSSC